MRQYVIDDIRPDDLIKLKAYLEEHFSESCFDGLYWVPLEYNLLTTLQKDHKACQPHYFAIEMVDNKLCCELLVRTNQTIRCKCIGYATGAQRNWLINFIDAIIEKLSIKA
jgi:hypothetical protein